MQFTYAGHDIEVESDGEGYFATVDGMLFNMDAYSSKEELKADIIEWLEFDSRGKK